MENFRRLFKYSRCNVIGMIHLRALPGTPKSRLNVDALSDMACREMELLVQHNLDGLIIENMHDVPYVKSSLIGPEIVSAMTRICSDVKRNLPSDVPCGLQVLAGGNNEAMAIAHSTGLDFIRCEGFVFGHVADEGYIDSCAGSLMRYRKNIGADNVQVYCDIKKKHSAHSITSDVSLAETAKAAEFFLADGLIVTGNATGDPAKPSDFEEVFNGVELPVFIGSGVTADNVHQYSKSHGLIIGSHFKTGGRWDQEIDPDRVKRFMEKMSALRENLE